MKGRLRKLVLLVLLGAIVNVAVAWGCALWVNPFAPFKLNRGGPRNWGRGVDSQDRPGWSIDYWRFFGGMRIYSRPFNLVHMRLRESGSEFEVVDTPRWSRVNQPITAGELAKNQGVVEEARGWPLLTFSSDFEVNRRSDPVLFLPRQVDLEWQQLPSLGGPPNGFAAPAVPFRPIWAGFAINTIFYAAVLWLLSLAPFTLRRVIRRRRGLCPKCGYDLRGTAYLICSECGYEVRAEAGT